MRLSSRLRGGIAATATLTSLMVRPVACRRTLIQRKRWIHPGNNLVCLWSSHAHELRSVDDMQECKLEAMALRLTARHLIATTKALWERYACDNIDTKLNFACLLSTQTSLTYNGIQRYQRMRGDSYSKYDVTSEQALLTTFPLNKQNSWLFGCPI